MLHAPLHALQVVLYARLEHVLDDGRACTVFLAVILVEDAVSEAAARNDEVFAAAEFHEAARDRRTCDDDVGTLCGKPAELSAVRTARLDDGLIARLEAFARNDVVVDARELVARLVLIHLREVSDGAADADDGQTPVLRPRNHLAKLFFYMLYALVEDALRHDVLHAELVRHCHRAQRYGNRLLDLAVQNERHLDRCAAEVELDEILRVYRVHDAEVTEVCLALTRDDLNLDACLFADALDELRPIGCAPRRRRRDRDAARDLHDLHHVLVDVQALKRTLHAVGIEPTRFRHALAEPNRLLLLILQEIRMVVVDLHDDEPNAVRPHVDDRQIFHRCSPSL